MDPPGNRKGHTFVLNAWMTALSHHFEDLLNNRFP